jgi:hypothetical protein
MEMMHPPLRSALRLPIDPSFKVYWDIPGLLGTMTCMSVVALIFSIGILAWRVRNIASDDALPSEQVPPPPCRSSNAVPVFGGYPMDMVVCMFLRHANF